MTRRMLARSLLLGLSLLLAGLAPARSQQPVDLNLVLAVDASGSVDAYRFNLQKQGYADAFANPKVLQAIRSGPLQSIAVAMVQWTGPSLQAVGITQGYYFFNAAPYILTLIIMIISAGSKTAARDVPGELSITK